MIRLTGIAFVMMLGIVTFSFGQDEGGKSYISKGQWLVGGKLSFSTGEDFDNYAFSIAPMGGYFFTKKLAAGLRVRYEHGNIVSIDSELTGNYQNFSATPFVRYYFGINKLAPFAEVAYGGNWYKTETSFMGDPSVSKSNSTSYSGGIGLNYFVSKNVALEGVVKYSKTIDSYYDGSVGFDLGLQFFISRKNSSSATDEEVYISKGQWLIGGSGNISLGTVDELDFNQFSIAPMGGYFVGNKIAVGLSTGYNYYRSSSQSFFVLPFARYYFTQNKLAPFAEVGYGGSWARFEYSDTTGDVVEKISGTGYRIGAGLNYFISKNIALEGNLRYTRNSDSDSGSFGLSAGLQFFIR
jgi:opacity protein-like surface antigen